VDPSETAFEPNFEFATPSAAFGSVIPESPVINSTPFRDDSYPASYSSDVDFMEPKTSTPNEIDSEDTDSEAVEEERVETDVNEEEMLTDDEDSNMDFKSFAADKGSENQVSADSMPSGLLGNVMEISEDESEKLEVSDDDIAASNESFASAANESFFSTHTQISLNTSNVSFASALDATLIGDDDEDEEEDPGCPITKKRRAEISMDGSIETPEVDYLSEQISPSKFWAPPALSKISRQPDPSTSNVDLR
jgi:hypothetical protein